MMSMLNLLWIVPLVAAVAWGFGYKANPERVKAFVKAHIVDDDPYQDEGHSATRYAPEPGESPIAREARKAAEVGITRPEEIAAAKHIIKTGSCGGIYCSVCPLHTNTILKGLYNCVALTADLDGWTRNWLLDHGINPDEASK